MPLPGGETPLPGGEQEEVILNSNLNPMVQLSPPPPFHSPPTPQRGYYIAAPGRGAGRDTSSFTPTGHIVQSWIITPNCSIPICKDHRLIYFGFGHHASGCLHHHSSSPMDLSPSRLESYLKFREHGAVLLRRVDSAERTWS